MNGVESEPEEVALVERTASPITPNKSNNSDQENTNETNKAPTVLRLVAIEKLLAPKSEPEDEPITNGHTKRRAATLIKSTSIIEITSSDATSDDEIIFVSKSRKATKTSRKVVSSDDESSPVKRDTSKPSSSKASPDRGSLKVTLKVPKNAKFVSSSSDDDSEISRSAAGRNNSKHKRSSKSKLKQSEDDSCAEIGNTKLKKLKVAIEKLPENLKSIKDDLALEEICTFSGKAIESLDKIDGIKKITNGKAAASDSDSDIPIAKTSILKGILNKKKPMATTKQITIDSSSESDDAFVSKSKKNERQKKINLEPIDDSDSASTSQKTRRKDKKSKSEKSSRSNRTKEKADNKSENSEEEEEEEEEAVASESSDSSDESDGGVKEKRTLPKRGTRARPTKKASEDEAEKEEGSDESDLEKKITKKSAVTKKRKLSSDSFDAEEPSSSDSDSDAGKKKKKKDDDSDYEKKEASSKKRRRIKQATSSSEEGSDKDNSPNKGRKNIRKVLGTKSLEESTLRAAREERERKQRIEERQKVYNQLYSEKPEEVKVLDQLVLDFDEKTKKPLIEVDHKLVRKLKPHQANGVKFMWNACFESLERMEKNDGSGCILGHCMGLGKTLQVITLIHTLILNAKKTGIERVLVVCPINIILNWVNEFRIWMKHVEKGKNLIEVFELSKFKKVIERAYKLNEWYEDGGVMIIGYDMYRNLSNEVDKKKGNKKVKDFIQKSLIDPGPDIVICDEGHLLKNEKTSLSKAMNKVTTLRRIVLTGTPLQNNLKEYYCMVSFVKPNLLGKYQEYMNRFVNPITNGQYADSTDYDIKIMKRRSHVLHKMLDGCVQRRDYSVLAPFLPPKHEYIISIRLTKLQVELYKFYMENKARQMDPTKAKRSNILFSDFQNLQRIWTHPRVLRYNSDRFEQSQAKKALEESDSEGSLKEFIDDDEDSAEDTPASTSEDDNNSDASVKSADKPKQRGRKRGRKTRAAGPADEVPDIETIEKVDNPTEWWMPLVPEEELLNVEHSGKLLVLLAILEECEAIGDKLLVFSQSLFSLDVIEHFLGAIDEQTQTQTSDGKIKFTGSWSLGSDYFRLDGSTPVEQRNAACNSFNRADNLRSRLFLISTRAGGLGINLVAANRVVIFDVSWNPSHDIQSIFRVYRFGQIKPCYVYRFLALGTMEEKIYERQVTKQAISKRVLDEQQIDRHYHSNDIQELYSYNVDPAEPRPIPALPKDRLFADILKKFDLVYKYHEHDSLLENKEEETLDEEERKAAWDDYEYEKNKPPPTFNSGNYANYTLPARMHGATPVTSNLIFGIRSDILLKLLTLKARQDNPLFNSQEIQQYIPYLTQELYKQVQEGELTLRNELLRLQTLLEMPQYTMNAAGAYVQTNQLANNLMMNPYAMSQQQMMNMYGASSSGNHSNMQQQELMQRAQSNLIRQAAAKIIPMATIEID